MVTTEATPQTPPRAPANHRGTCAWLYHPDVARRKPLPTVTRKPRPVTMQASAMRIDGASKAAPSQVKAAKQGWHARAWEMYDVVGEVKGGGRFMESACSRVKIALGITPGLGQDAVPLHDATERGLVSGAPGSPDDEIAQEEPVTNAGTVALAEELAANLINGQESEGSLLGGWGVKSFVVGEGWVIGYVDRDPITGAEQECWLCVSADEVLPNDNAKDGQANVLIRRMPSAGDAVMSSGSGDTATDIVLPADSFILRVWRKHARWGLLSDSNLHGCLDECDELRVLDASIKATGLSRINAGVLVVANEVEPRVVLEPDEGDDNENPVNDPLLVEIVKHTTTPVADPGSASAVAPFVMRVPAKVDDVPAKDLVFKLDLGRTMDPEVVRRCEYLRNRIGATLELPSDRITGDTGSMNHWNAWLIDEETYRLYVAPTVQPLMDALTTKYLRQRLEASGVPAQEAEHFVLFADPTELVTRPNRVDNATAAHDAMAIGDEAFRTALGFGDEDAPTPDEVVRRVIQRQTVLPADVIPLLNQIYGLDLEVSEPAIEAPDESQAPPPDDTQDDTQDDGSAGTEAPPNPTGDVAPEPGVTAALSLTAPGHAAHTATQSIAAVTAALSARRAGERLMGIDRRLRERIIVAADAALNRATERAGAKVRSSLSSARRGTERFELKAAVMGVPNRELLKVLGDRVTMVADPGNLFDGELDDLEAQWDEWLAGANDEVVSIAAQTLGVNPDGEAIAAFKAKQADGRREGWIALSAGLVAMARGQVFDRSPGSIAAGEVANTVVPPGLVRQALAIAGGSTPTRTRSGGVADGAAGGYAGGVATGDDTAQLWGAYGQPWQGFEWVYNFEGQSTFEPHLDLNGVRFSDWNDEALSTAGTFGDWVGDFYFPGDHGGCRCDAIPVWD